MVSTANLHPYNEGNGLLEMDEITEVFQSYADLKQAQKSGSIPIRFVCAVFRVPLTCSAPTRVRMPRG